MNALLTDLSWYNLLSTLRGKKVHLHVPNGNTGDKLITQATKLLFFRNKIQIVSESTEKEVLEDNNFTSEMFKRLDRTDIVLYGGGGNVCGRYDTRKVIKKLGDMARFSASPFVCLPQSIEHFDLEVMENFDHIHIRDQVSYQMMCQAGFGVFTSLTPDLALSYGYTEIAKNAMKFSRNDIGIFKRKDGEKRLTPEEDCKDPAEICNTPEEYFALASDYNNIITDRLHFAIAGILMRKNVTLIGNNYHKNKSIWESYLNIFCNYRDNF